MPLEDLPKWQRIAVPIWFKWANKDKDAARLFKLQLEVMENPDGRLRHARHVQGPQGRGLTRDERVARARARATGRNDGAACGAVVLCDCLSERHDATTQLHPAALAVLGGARALPASSRCTSSRARSGRTARPGPSLFVAYLFWLTAGFLGIHRFYLRSAVGLRLHSGVPGRDLCARAPIARRARRRVAHLRGAASRRRRRPSRASPPPSAPPRTPPSGRRRRPISSCGSRNTTRRRRSMPDALQARPLGRDRARRDAAHRRGAAARPRAPPARRWRPPIRRSKSRIPTRRGARRAAPARIRRSPCTRGSPMPSNGVNVRVGEYVVVLGGDRGVRLLLRSDGALSCSIRRPTGCTRACS